MSRFTHFQIIEWCVRYREAETDMSTELLDIVDDIVIQWELFIASSYSLEQMRSFSLSDIVLPKHYFEQWLEILLQKEHDESAQH